jgi:RsiW-degrading membrane proteinase PrsW (M82 family)
MRDHIDITPKKTKTIGFIAVMLAVIPGVILLLLLGVTELLIPCTTPTGGPGSGWYGCNNDQADTIKIMLGFTFLGYVALLLPASFITGIVAIVKNSGRGLGILAIAPAILSFLGSFLPMLYLSISLGL